MSKNKQVPVPPSNEKRIWVQTLDSGVRKRVIVGTFDLDNPRAGCGPSIEAAVACALGRLEVVYADRKVGECIVRGYPSGRRVELVLKGNVLHEPCSLPTGLAERANKKAA